mgnify:CR=1 FL=1
MMTPTLDIIFAKINDEIDKFQLFNYSRTLFLTNAEMSLFLDFFIIPFGLHKHESIKNIIVDIVGKRSVFSDILFNIEIENEMHKYNKFNYKTNKKIIKKIIKDRKSTRLNSSH